MESEDKVEEMEELKPQLTELHVGLKRALLEHPLRSEVQGLVGAQAFALWETDVLACDPKIKEGLVVESKTANEYIELTASAEFEFMDETLNLSTITKHTQSPDRRVRHDCLKTMWGWFEENGAELDRIFDDLVGQQSERPAIATGWRRRAGELRDMCFDATIDFRRYGRSDAQLSHQDRIGTFQDGFFPPALDGSFGDIERIGNSLVSPRRPKFSLVALEQRFGTDDFP